MIPFVSSRQLAWRLRAVFGGNLPPKEYLTPNVWLKNPGWGDEVFNRIIERLEFFLPTGHRIILAGMERYNFFVEAAQSTRSRHSAEIKAFYFLGKLPGKNVVEMWRVGNGRVIHYQKPWGKEWGGTSTRGWKPGLVGGCVISRIAND
jgi:hypothetical protein